MEPKYKIAAIPQRQTVEWCPITPYVDLDQYQPRSQGSFLPALRSEREKEREREREGGRERERERHWKTLVTCLSESGRLQTNDLGEGQVSVRFVSTERRQVSAAMKLCT